jgi:O-antigen/teichoic acid export membrane protein
MADSALKKKTTYSLIWSFIDKFGQQILNFASMLVLMNMLEPGDYGLTGSLAVFTAFSTILIDSGFGRALLNRKDVSETDYSTVFYFNILLSAALYLLLYFAAPSLEKAFHAPCLASVARGMFLALIFNAFAVVLQVMIVKRGDFRGMMRINLLSLLLANGMAIFLAVIGCGVWALVAQVLMFSSLRSMFLLAYVEWFPEASFSFARLKTFFAFSSRLLCSSLISGITNNIYPSLIAAFYPMRHVAFFNQAKKYQEVPFLALSNTFRSVAMLILSEINDDRERLARVVSKLIKSIAFLAFPVGILMIVLAEPLFFLCFKAKWLAAVPYFQALTIAGMFSPFVYIFHELFIAKERSDFFLGLEVAKGALLIALILLLFPKGIMALAASWIVYMIITLIASAILSGRLIGYRPLRFFKDTFPYLFVSLGAVGCAEALPVTQPLLRIAVEIPFACILYLVMCKILKLEMLKEIEQLFKKKSSINHSEKSII